MSEYGQNEFVTNYVCRDCKEQKDERTKMAFVINGQPICPVCAVPKLRSGDYKFECEKEVVA